MTANIEQIGKNLWAAADKLRGSMDASEYKHVVLGLIFLKYISDKFTIKYKQLVDEGEGFEEDIDEYTAEGIFFMPPQARWNVIAQNANSPAIGSIIDEAMLVIESENPKLKGILPKNYARPELDKSKLGEVVNIFTNMALVNNADVDLLGQAYEYCLGEFAAQEGKRGGEFYTPQSVVKILVEVLEPYKGRIYDPACGSGGMFVQSAKFITAHQGSRNDISVYGQESNPTTWKLCMMNLAIRGIEANFGRQNADSFTNDQHAMLKADYIMANPPFNQEWQQAQVKNDARWKYGLPPAANANFAWLQHMIHHLSVNGSMGVILANGSMTSNAGGEGEIRKNIIEDDLVESMLALPAQLFSSTQIPVCIWFLSKNKKIKGETLFIDARNMGQMINRKQKELTDDDIQTIAQTIHNWQKGEGYVDKLGFCKSATLQEIKDSDYMLTPGRYVGIEEEEDDFDFAERFNELTVKFEEQLKEEAILNQRILANLAKVDIDG